MMDTEDALFKAADALVGMLMEQASLERYISMEDVNGILDACKNANKDRYMKEIVIYL
jgi:hypothetical protein